MKRIMPEDMQSKIIQISELGNIVAIAKSKHWISTLLLQLKA